LEAPKKAARTRKSKSLNGSSAAGSEVPVSLEMGPQSLTLPTDLRIGTAASTYGEFRALNPARPLMIDASGVAKIDAAGMQAVVAGLHLRMDSANWTWQAPTETFVRAARLLGLHSILALPA
jgi:anti-anti-sigma regulatory factor